MREGDRNTCGRNAKSEGRQRAVGRMQWDGGIVGGGKGGDVDEGARGGEKRNGMG